MTMLAALLSPEFAGTAAAQSAGAGVPAAKVAGEGPGAAPSPAPAGSGSANPRQFATYRVYATQYDPLTPGSVEVAVPDKCAKFAALRNQVVLNDFGCPSSYRLDLNYQVFLSRDNGRTSTIPVKDVGPWNLDDNYWASPGSTRPRRSYTDLARGVPEAQAAFYNGYNTVPNCISLETGQPSGRPGGADQFGRCVLNPAGIDLSVEAAKQLGLAAFENAWLTVSFLWEPVDSSIGQTTPPSTYRAVTPARVLDTRSGIGGAASPLGPNGTIDVKVTGVGGVPADGVTAVALNLTATNASAYSYLTAWPTGDPRPEASNINFYPGRSTPNLVMAKVGAGGKVSIYNIFGNVDVLADVAGWYSASPTDATNYVPLNPSRLLDTRAGTGAPAAKIGADGSINLKVTGVGGVPSDNVSAVVLNVTATNASSTESYLTLFPAGADRSITATTSNVNFVAGEHVPNLAITRVGDSGNVSIFNKNGSVDVVADVQGYYTAAPGARYVANSPIRILDTRRGIGTSGVVGQLSGGNTLELTVAGVGGVPTGATAVVLNMAVADSPGPASFLTVYPQGTTRPLASNLNWAADQTKSLLVVARINNGKVSIYNDRGSTNVIADVQGWFVP